MNLIHKTIIPFDLAPRAYIPTSTVKTHIVLHGSFSRTKYTFTGEERSETCLMKRWNIMQDKYSGHYVIGRSGSVYSCMHEDFWSNHLALGKAGSDMGKKSIAIFLSNELYLEKENSQFYAFAMNKPHNLYDGPVFEHKFQGKSYWADYDEIQINVLINLIKDICERNMIEPTMFPDTARYNRSSWDYANIISCANVNSTSFSLPFPAWVMEKLAAGGITLIS